MTVEFHWNEPLYLIQHHTPRRTSNIHVRLKGLDQEYVDVFCPLFVQEVDMFQLLPHLENINDMWVEAGTLHTGD
jgi:hypothetical protein